MSRPNIARINILGGELGVSYDGDGSRLALRKAQQIAHDAGNFTAAHNEAGRLFMTNIRRQYIAEGRPDKWAPLRPSTIAEKQRLGYGGRGILVRTGELKNSWRFTATNARMRVYNTKRVGRYNLAAIHENGVPRNNLPARKQTQITPEFRRRIFRVYRRHLGLE